MVIGDVDLQRVFHIGKGTLTTTIVPWLLGGCPTETAAFSCKARCLMFHQPTPERSSRRMRPIPSSLTIIIRCSLAHFRATFNVLAFACFTQLLISSWTILNVRSAWESLQ